MGKYCLFLNATSTLTCSDPEAQGDCTPSSFLRARSGESVYDPSRLGRVLEVETLKP